jgi:VanZ family protein
MKVVLDNNITKYWLLVCIYAAFIFILSSMSHPPSPPGTSNIPSFEIIEHLFLYFGFGLVLYLAMNHSNNHFFRKYRIQMTVLIGTLYGITDEIHQLFVPFREASVLDVVVDGCGVVLALSLILLIDHVKNS